MTIIITDDDVKRLLSMQECIQAMRVAFSDFAKGIAVNRPRMRYLAQHPDPERKYLANVHVGAVPSYGIACVRAGSQVIKPPSPTNDRRLYENPQAFNWGIVILYSLETAEPLALMHEFQLSGMRVGATTGVAVDQIARPDAATLGLFGTGKQAHAALEAIACVRPIRRVNVYSPSAEHRAAFVRDMARDGMEIVPATDPRAVVAGADIVCCATTAMKPVFDGDWLEDGQLVVSIANSDVTNKRSEVDRRTYERANAVIVNDWESVIDNDQTELLDPLKEGVIREDQVHELGNLLIGKVDIRQPARGDTGKGIIYFKNNSGLAIQFAAAGGILHQKAIQQANNKTIPTEWLGSDLSSYYAAGFGRHRERVMTMQPLRMAGATLAAILSLGGPVAADDVADFYRGKRLNLVIGYGPGGGYDTYARLLARFIGEHIPGRPTVIPQNMPGAGSRGAANWLYNVAPKDGTVVATLSQTTPTDQALGQSGIQFDARRFNWIGNMVVVNNIMVIWAETGVKTIEDARQRQLAIGATGASSPSVLYPQVTNNLLGTKFKIVSGYPGGGDINIALERREVDGRGSDSWASMKANNQRWLRERKINILFQIGPRRETDLPDVPLWRELGQTDEQRQILDVLSGDVAVGRPILTAPDVPADRVKALREAFDRTLRDPQFVAAAEKAGMLLNPIGGEELQAIVERIAGPSPGVIERVKQAITIKDATIKDDERTPEPH